MDFKFKSFSSKGRQEDLNYEAVPLSPSLYPTIPSHVRGACNGAKAPHAFKKLGQILKIYEQAYHGSKFSAKRSVT